MNEIKTQGNFMSYGPQGERRAAFALESDKQLFEAAEDLLGVCKAIVREANPYAATRNWPTAELFADWAVEKARAAVAKVRNEEG